jgi:hypothetical protein
LIFYRERERESSKIGYSPEFISTSVFVIKTDSQKYFDILKNKKKKEAEEDLYLFFFIGPRAISNCISKSSKL